VKKFFTMDFWIYIIYDAVYIYTYDDVSNRKWVTPATCHLEKIWKFRSPMLAFANLDLFLRAFFRSDIDSTKCTT
jgi:hypothetical protein